MSIKNARNTPLGRILIIGPHEADQALWQIDARAARVPTMADGEDQSTPGVHAMRTLLMRSLARRIGTTEGREEFYDPTLLDLFVAQGDDSGKFTLSIFGEHVDVALEAAGRIDITPLRKQPAYDNEEPKKLFVSPFESTVGKLSVPDPTALLGLLPFLDVSARVDFDRQGVEYTALALAPNGNAVIKTRVRLTWKDKKITLELLPDRQEATASAAWLQAWQTMRSMADRMRVTAWARLDFNLGSLPPALTWPVAIKADGKLELSWAKVRLPAGLMSMTLSDQPAESQLLGPEMLMTLTPANVVITRNGDRMEFDTTVAIARQDLEYSYLAGRIPVEHLRFPGPLPMVHVPAQVRSSLRRAYAGQAAQGDSPITGFLQEADGWVELPFAAAPALPPRVLAQDDQLLAHGSMLVGLRRRELHRPGADSMEVPWSMRIDSPRHHEVHLVFQAGVPRSIDIRMQESTVQGTGLLWLANRAPDGHDALPVVDDDPAAFFDVILDRADISKTAAPFTLHGLTMTAPVCPAGGWDDLSEPRWKRAPALDKGFGFTVNFAVVSANAAVTPRAWLRHATLPVIQCMPATRSDTTSARPHASRSLTLFQQAAGQLRFNAASAMAPSIEKVQRDKFKAVTPPAGVAPALVALSLPGIELRPESPALYHTMGRFGLPLLDEVFARATLPLPPDAKPPPAPAPVTALQPDELTSMWAEQARLREVAATQSSVMFGFGAFDIAIALEETALAEPRILKASAKVSGAVTVSGGVLQMGSVAFSQAAPAWSWSASGDALLAGPGDTLDFASAGKVAIGHGADRLLGWTFAERAARGFVVDGCGVGWATDVRIVGGMSMRDLEIEDAGGGHSRRALASSVEPLVIGGTGGPAWQLAFTDLPMPGSGAGTWTPGPLVARLATFEQGWTWSLYPALETAMKSLPLHGIFLFAPAALTSVDIGVYGVVKKAVVQGALTLGVDNPSHASNSCCRVALNFVYDAGLTMLVLDAIVPLDDAAGKRVRWDLDATHEASVIASGVTQFSAEPVLKNGVLQLLAAELDVTLFGGRTTVALGDVASGGPVKWESQAAPPVNLELRLTRIDIDLKKARLLVIGMSAGLRDGVRADITETLDVSDKDKRVVATVDWFGSTSTWSVDIDDLRRTVFLSAPRGDGMTVFPGLNDARIDQGVVCLTLDAPLKYGKFTILTHFAEFILVLADELRVSHLMHSIANANADDQDSLRFDGKLRRKSLVTWPDLHTGDIASNDSIDVEFATADEVVHEATFLLSDHRLSGAAIRPAKGRGLALKRPAQGSAPVTWLAEATHRLSWRSGGIDGPETLARAVQCLHVLQLWGADSLGATLKEQAGKFGFTPSYTGGNSSVEFPNHGVRQVSHAFSGLFEKDLRKPIEDLGEQWLMLGNMSALCPRIEGDLFQPLHLPFIGALHDAAHLNALRKQLGGRIRSASSVLRMSRHDVLGTPMRVDAASATPAGLLAAPPPSMPIAFARAAVPADTLSGAALGAGWFRNDGKPSEAGVHVEQIQFPGRADQRPLMPHPFPRAAVMLDYFKRAPAVNELPALSVLVQSIGTGIKFEAKVRTVQIQPAASARSAAERESTSAELIIGDAAEIATRMIDADADQAGNARQLLALAMEYTGEPTFLVLRHAGKPGAQSYTQVELPARKRDQLAFASRPLRSLSTFSIDGRLTWPEPAVRARKPAKAALHVGFSQRSPFQHVAAGLTGLHGRVTPGRVAGDTFTLGNVSTSPDSVWLQEWERVAFAVASGDTEDASPRPADRAVAVRPMAPSATAIAAAIGRMDPLLQKLGVARMQTYLPPLIDDIDLPTRTGCMTESGLRILSTWGEGTGRQDVQALAGSAMTRAIRAPRPAATPANTGASDRWRRTVSWYAQPGTSCLALKGAWDMLAAEPAASDIPPWCILLGKPARAGLEMAVANQEQAWKGAVRVACVVFALDANGRLVRQLQPAHFVMNVLDREKASVRAGLRWGDAWIPYRRLNAVGADVIEFSPDPKSVPLSGDRMCRFECGWVVGSGNYTDAQHAGLDLLPYAAPKTLDPAAFRKLVLNVPTPMAGDYPLPLTQRSVFFSDPAFDRRLSHVKALSDSANDSSGKPFSLWIDRPSVTPAEALVLRAFAADKNPPSFTLKATVRRKDHRIGGIFPLKFDLNTAAEEGGAIKIAGGVYLALPLSILADDSGVRLAPGDMLMLELGTMPASDQSVRLAIPVRTQSALSPPAALYSLIAVDAANRRAWCAAHSPAPQPDGLTTHVSLDANGESVARRGLFKWRVTQPADNLDYGYSICRTDLATESMHVPDVVELELQTP